MPGTTAKESRRPGGAGFCEAAQPGVRAAALPTMKVLVTGASGLVGRRLVPHLLRQGMAVTAFVRTPATFDVAGHGLDVAAGRVENLADVERAATGCDAVVHLANASHRLGRSLNIDPETERVIDDEEANQLLRGVNRSYRNPFVIPDEV